MKIHVTDGVTSADFNEPITITTISAPPPPSPPRWQADFFNNETLAGVPVLSKQYDAINFNWGNGSPDPLVNVDSFSARFVRTSDWPAGAVEWTVTADDGVRLWVDGQLLIDQWRITAPATYKAHLTLTAGPHTEKLEYYEHGGGAVCQASSASYTGPPEPPPPVNRPWMVRELGVHKMGEGLKEPISGLFINNNLEANRVAASGHYGGYRHWPAHADPVQHARSFNTPQSTLTHKCAFNEGDSDMGRKAGESWDSWFGRIVAYEQAFVRTRYNDNGDTYFLSGAWPMGNFDVTKPEALDSYRRIYAPWFNAQAIDGHPITLIEDYHSYSPDLGNIYKVMGQEAADEEWTYYPDFNDQYDRVEVPYRKRMLDGTWQTFTATLLKPNHNLRGLSQLHDSAPTMTVTLQDWYETRWHWFYWSCEFDPRIQGIGASETGKDTMGSGGFNLPGIGQQDFINWCIRFIDISCADIEIPVGQKFAGVWKSPWKFAYIYQYSGDPSWQTYNITQLMQGFPLNILTRAL